MKKLLLLIFFVFNSLVYTQIDFDMTGYFTDMPVLQNTNKTIAQFTGQKENSFLNIGRLRLRPAIHLNDDFRLNVEYEINSLYYNSELPFGTLNSITTNRQIYSLNRKLYVNKNFASNHFIDRLYFKYMFEFGDLTIGRQRISWGSGRIWNPTDLFNPINPANFSKIEKDGADAVSFTFYLADFSDVQFVYNPVNKFNSENYGFRIRTNFDEYDLSCISGKFDDAFVFGLDFAGNLFEAGVRGEGIYSNNSHTGKEFVKYILGIDYQFTPEIYAMLEYHFNGEGKTNKFDYEFERLLLSEIINLSKNYLSAGLNILISPLLTLSVSNLYNINDKSGFSALIANYSVSEEMYLSLGSQITFGTDFTEFWYFPQSYYLKADYFF